MIDAALPTESALSAADFATSPQKTIAFAIPSTTATGSGSQYMASASSTAAHVPSTSFDHRNLTIILSTVIPVVTLGLILAIGLVLCLRRRRLGRPWGTKRGATPIDDDEIATWRGDAQPMAQTPKHHHKSSSIVFTPVSDVHYSPNLGPLTPKSIGEVPAMPPIARAPNARSGLTDEAVPGADPFIQPSRRQSTKLSKRPGHGRNGSARSLSSFPGTESFGAGLVFDVDPETIQRHMRENNGKTLGRAPSAPDGETQMRGS